MVDTVKTVLNLYGKTGNTWAARLTAAAIEQSKSMVSSKATSNVSSAGEARENVGGVSLAPKYVREKFAQVKQEYEHKLKMELIAMGKEPREVAKLKIDALEDMKKELLNKPSYSPKLSPKLLPPGHK